MVVSPPSPNWDPILEHSPQLSDLLGTEFWVARDDLLPFPLPGNKVRKIAAELDSLAYPIDVLITNGSTDSNHCRTLAMMAVRRGIRVHLILHGKKSSVNNSSLRILHSLGATFDVGPPATIRERICSAQEEFISQGKRVHIISGGGHTPAGAKSFRDAGILAFQEVAFDQAFVASGTGATQGGLIAAAEQSRTSVKVLGVSVARTADRGIPPVREAAVWAGTENPSVVFLDEYRAGGYGMSDDKVSEAVNLGWQHGLPLDTTYTGKTFSAILDWSQRGLLGSSVLFWHTGGLWNWLSSNLDSDYSQR